MNIVAKHLTRAAFAAYVAGLDLKNKAAWAKFVVLHNTGAPTLAERPAGLTAQHIENLKAYYESKGWHAGPHCFVDDLGIWVFSPLTAPGVHSFDWNSCSFGVEQLGDFDAEAYDSGRGLAVQQNAIACVAILSYAAGIDSSTMRLHKENTITDHKDCPGHLCADHKSRFISDVHDYIVAHLLTPPTKTTMLVPTHPAAKAVVRVVHQAVTAVLSKVAPNAPVRPYGMHPLAWQAYLKTGLPVNRIGQTIGDARASAGTHAKDGEYQGHDYAACTDFHISDYSDAQNYAFCTNLAGAGFAPYYRKPGVNGWPSQDARHDHAIWPDCPMKPMVQNQIHDYLADRNGLVGHDTYLFRPPTKPECDRVRAAFLASNPAN